MPCTARPARALWTAGLLAPLLLLAGCSGSAAPAKDVNLVLWTHGGTTQERAALTASVTGFEHAHPHVHVQVVVKAEGDYTTTLQSAVAAGRLPDVADVDGPLVAAFADQGALAPLDDLLPSATADNLIDTLRTQGTWHGKLWALGTFDSGLGIWADRTALQRAGVRVPTGPGDAWTIAELQRALRSLAAHDPDGRVLDLKLDYGVGEWLTYAFSPLLASAGGDLEHLTSAADEAALTAMAGWRPYLDDDKDGASFARGRAPLSWGGHWLYPEYRAALGDRLVLLPLPDLGQGSRTGSGSWAWAVTASSPHAAEAAQLLTWFASDAQVAAMTTANGAIPGTRTALARSTALAPGGPLHLFEAQRTARQAVPRPVTPAYPALTAAFAQAVHAVLTGMSPRAALAVAARDAGQR